MRNSFFSTFLILAAFGRALAAPVTGPTDIRLGVNRSTVLEIASGVRRVLVGNPEIAEAVAVSPSEIVVNGKLIGDTTLVLWTQAGERILHEIHVVPPRSRTEMVSEELARELPGQDVSFRADDGQVFLRGTVADLSSADRAVAIASTIGKVTNLLNVKVPPAQPQILLKVRFANVDRAATQELGANFISTAAGKTPGMISTGQFSPPFPDSVGDTAHFTFSDALNIFFYRPDLDFGATIRALEAKQLVQILAEPNLIAMSGKPASFLAGGEFPFPTLQGGGGGVGQITIQFREFGVRIHFLPTITPRGTIHLVVTPEVSSLDFAHGLVVQGFTVPGLATRRVETELELSSGQSFVIAGLLDNRLQETINKIPGLGDIPLLGKLFQSRSQSRNHSELLVLVTPELVDPIPVGAPRPAVTMPKPFMKGVPTEAPQNPVSNVMPSAAESARRETLPVEVMRDLQMGSAPTAAPVPVTPALPTLPAAPVGLPPAAAAAPPVPVKP